MVVATTVSGTIVSPKVPLLEGVCISSTVGVVVVSVEVVRLSDLLLPDRSIEISINGGLVVGAIEILLVIHLDYQTALKRITYRLPR